MPIQSNIQAAVLTAGLVLSCAVAAHAQERSAPVNTRMVEVDGQQMRVQTAGWHHRERGQPIVVFENGAGTPIEAWEPVLAAVAEFAPVVAYDRSGIGQSPWDERPPTPEHVNRKLRTLLEQVDAPPPYVLVGFSWGGALIQYFAGHWPDEVAYRTRESTSASRRTRSVDEIRWSNYRFAYRATSRVAVRVGSGDMTEVPEPRWQPRKEAG